MYLYQKENSKGKIKEYTFNFNNKLLKFIDDLYSKESFPKNYKKTIKKSKLFSSWIIQELYKKNNYSNDNYKFLLIPQNKDFFTNHPHFSYYSMKLSLYILCKYNIINKIKGYADWKIESIFNKEGEETGYVWDKIESKCTSIRLNDCKLWNNIDISYLNFHAMMNKEYNKKYPVINRIKIKIKNLKTQVIENPCNIDFSNIEKINKFLEKKNLSEFKYQRIFGSENNKYGRFYSSFQFLSKEERNKIIKEQNWIDIDFKSLSPQTLYILKTGKFYSGEDIYNDIYKSICIELNKDENFYFENVENIRPIIKQILNVLISCQSKSKSKSAISQILYENKIHSYFTSIDSIIDIIEKVHYEIKDMFYNEYASLTQNIESNIIEKIMLKQIELKILPLTVHDCVIVPKEYKDYFESLMYYFLFQECKLVIQNPINIFIPSSYLLSIINFINLNIKKYFSYILNFKFKMMHYTLSISNIELFLSRNYFINNKLLIFKPPD